MLYEVVDPAKRDERGLIYNTLTAAMVAASPTLEVYEVADEPPHTRLVRCWPDAEFEPAAASPSTAEGWRGKGRREATMILAECGVLGPNVLDRDGLLGLMCAAWLKGVSYGAHETLEAAEQAMREIGGAR